MRLAAAATAALLHAAPALAQGQPQMVPTRDVAVTYRVTGPATSGAGQLPELTMSWLASAAMLRMDIPGFGWTVVDQRNNRAFSVMEQMRMIMDVPPGQVLPGTGLPPGATFQRGATEAVAGLSCTVWTYQDREGNGRACITADGVMLRGEGTRGGQSGGLEALRVAYGPQDPARFQRPQGYQTMQMPQGAMPGARPTR
jgi:hypothetical protein